MNECSYVLPAASTNPVRSPPFIILEVSGETWRISAGG